MKSVLPILIGLAFFTLVSVSITNRLRIPPNPCPGVFQYYRKPKTGVIYGQVFVPFNGAETMELRINASMVGAGYSKKILIIEKAAKNAYFKKVGKAIYNIFFPFLNVIPRITKITYNGQVYCQGEDEKLTELGTSSLFGGHLSYLNIMVTGSGDRSEEGEDKDDIEKDCDGRCDTDCDGSCDQEENVIPPDYNEDNGEEESYNTIYEGDQRFDNGLTIDEIPVHSPFSPWWTKEGDTFAWPPKWSSEPTSDNPSLPQNSHCSPFSKQPSNQILPEYQSYPYAPPTHPEFSDPNNQNRPTPTVCHPGMPGCVIYPPEDPDCDTRIQDCSAVKDPLRPGCHPGMPSCVINLPERLDCDPNMQDCSALKGYIIAGCHPGMPGCEVSPPEDSDCDPSRRDCFGVTGHSRPICRPGMPGCVINPDFSPKPAGYPDSNPQFLPVHSENLENLDQPGPDFAANPPSSLYPHPHFRPLIPPLYHDFPHPDFSPPKPPSYPNSYPHFPPKHSDNLGFLDSDFPPKHPGSLNHDQHFPPLIPTGSPNDPNENLPVDDTGIEEGVGIAPDEDNGSPNGFDPGEPDYPHLSHCNPNDPYCSEHIHLPGRLPGAPGGPIKSPRPSDCYADDPYCSGGIYPPRCHPDDPHCSQETNPVGCIPGMPDCPLSSVCPPGAPECQDDTGIQKGVGIVADEDNDNQNGFDLGEPDYPHLSHCNPNDPYCSEDIHLSGCVPGAPGCPIKSPRPSGCHADDPYCSGGIYPPRCHPDDPHCSQEIDPAGCVPGMPDCPLISVCPPGAPECQDDTGIGEGMVILADEDNDNQNGFNLGEPDYPHLSHCNPNDPYCSEDIHLPGCVPGAPGCSIKFPRPSGCHADDPYCSGEVYPPRCYPDDPHCSQEIDPGGCVPGMPDCPLSSVCPPGAPECQDNTGIGEGMVILADEDNDNQNGFDLGDPDYPHLSHCNPNDPYCSEDIYLSGCVPGAPGCPIKPPRPSGCHADDPYCSGGIHTPRCHPDDPHCSQKIDPAGCVSGMPDCPLSSICPPGAPECQDDTGIGEGMVILADEDNDIQNGFNLGDPDYPHLAHCNPNDPYCSEDIHLSGCVPGAPGCPIKSPRPSGCPADDPYCSGGIYPPRCHPDDPHCSQEIDLGGCVPGMPDCPLSSVCPPGAQECQDNTGIGEGMVILADEDNDNQNGFDLGDPDYPHLSHCNPNDPYCSEDIHLSGCVPGAPGCPIKSPRPSGCHADDPYCSGGIYPPRCHPDDPHCSQEIDPGGCVPGMPDCPLSSVCPADEPECHGVIYPHPGTYCRAGTPGCPSENQNLNDDVYPVVVYPDREDPKGGNLWGPGMPVSPRPNQIIVESGLNAMCGLKGNREKSWYFRGYPEHDPWLVAIMVDTGTCNKYKCTGTLSSNGHVITTARCVKHSNGQHIHPKDLVLVMGTDDLRHWPTNGAIVRGCSNIHVTPGYNLEVASPDIAVITLDRVVETSAMVSPICVWEPALNQVVNNQGYGLINGWGVSATSIPQTSNFYSPIPSRASLTILPNDQCEIGSVMGRSLEMSDTEMCAGDPHGLAPCIGDSGDPFTIQVEDRHFLRGILSRSKVDQLGQCVRDTMILTDISKLSEWIFHIMRHG